MSNNLISVIVPAYNEQESLKVFLPQLVAVLKEQGTYEIIVVNDGSVDETAEVVQLFRDKNPAIHLISFSRNFGAQAALRAGYYYARGNCVISMDADMQHPVDVVPGMIEAWQRGSDIVCAVRKKSTHLGCFKRITAALFYRLFNLLVGGRTETGADFRLMSRRAVNALNQFHENNLFIRGVVSHIGFKTKILHYNEVARMYGGESRYTIKKMLNLALTGILGFSVAPIHIVVGLGMMILSGGLLGLVVLLICLLCGLEVGNTGLIICSLAVFSGIQTLSLGIIGEYVGATSISVKNRPLYLIEKNTLKEDIK